MSRLCYTSVSSFSFNVTMEPWLFLVQFLGYHRDKVKSLWSKTIFQFIALKYQVHIILYWLELKVIIFIDFLIVMFHLNSDRLYFYRLQNFDLIIISSLHKVPIYINIYIYIYIYIYILPV